jgi:hypothetical protein
MGKFLIALSGARPEILAQCPTERIKFQSLGWAILITCVMATISMWFALTSVLGFNPVLSFPVALIWGLIIMGIDRWLVTSMPTDGSSKLLMAAPRLVLAILLGTLISTPIVLRIFQSEINNQVSVIKQNDEAAFLTSQGRSVVVAQVAKWQKTVTNLQQVIDSDGAKPINPASDPVVQGLTAQLDKERSVAITDYHAWQCQLYGGCGAPPGSGPLAAASKSRYDADEQQIATLTGQIQAREVTLQDTSVTAQASRLQQAKNALPNAQNQLVAAQAEESTLQNNFQVTNNATNGLLIRLKALDQLSAGNGTLNMARILLFLLFLVIECLPVTVKLLQRPGNYEKIFAAVARHELNAAQRAVREDRVYRQPDRDLEFDPTAGPAPDWNSGYERERGARDPIDAEIENIWRQDAMTRLAPRDDWRASARTETMGDAEEELSGPSRHEDALLDRVTDFRDAERPSGDFHDTDWPARPGTANGQSRRQGGIEQHYDDDDL